MEGRLALTSMTHTPYIIFSWGELQKLMLLFFRSVLLDFAEPLTLPSMMDPGPSTSDSPIGATPLGSSPPEESIAILTSMGFPRAHSIRALKATVSLLLPTLVIFALSVLMNNFIYGGTNSSCTEICCTLIFSYHLFSC